MICKYFLLFIHNHTHKYFIKFINILYYIIAKPTYNSYKKSKDITLHLLSESLTHEQYKIIIPIYFLTKLLFVKFL